MKDFMGKELAEGDIVVHGSGVSGGLAGPNVVVGFTAKRVRVRRVQYEFVFCVPSCHLVKVTPDV